MIHQFISLVQKYNIKSNALYDAGYGYTTAQVVDG